MQLLQPLVALRHAARDDEALASRLAGRDEVAHGGLARALDGAGIDDPAVSAFALAVLDEPASCILRSVSKADQASFSAAKPPLRYVDDAHLYP